MHCIICNKWGCHDASHQAMIARGSMNGDVCNLCGHKIDDWRDHSMACSQRVSPSRTPITIHNWNVAIHNWTESCIPEANASVPHWGALMAEYQTVFNQAQDADILGYGEVGVKEVQRRMSLEA